MKTIAVVALKGGAGKTTVSLTLAEGLRLRGKRVVVLDLDTREQQGTARVWREVAAEEGHEDTVPVLVPAGVAKSPGQALRASLKTLDADIVVIDTPPAMGAESRAAIAVADLVIVPVAQGAPDIWALARTLEALEEVAAGRDDGGAKVLAVVNKLVASSSTGQAMRESVEAVGFTVAKTTWGHRVAFGDAMPHGLSVLSYAPGSEAAREASALVEEVAL